MDELPAPKPQPGPTVRADALAMLEGVAPGRYRSADLHPRYAALARSRGHEVASVKALGEALAQLGVTRATAHGNVSSWTIPSDTRTDG